VNGREDEIRLANGRDVRLCSQMAEMIRFGLPVAENQILLVNGREDEIWLANCREDEILLVNDREDEICLAKAERMRFSSLIAERMRSVSPKQ